jgi:hypothetical protein
MCARVCLGKQRIAHSENELDFLYSSSFKTYHGTRHAEMVPSSKKKDHQALYMSAWFSVLQIDNGIRKLQRFWIWPVLGGRLVYKIVVAVGCF